MTTHFHIENISNHYSRLDYQIIPQQNPGWLQIDPIAGSLMMQQTQTIALTADASQMSGAQTVTAMLEIHSNDTLNPLMLLPVHLHITSNPVSGIGNSQEIPTSFQLNQNHPNPFNPSTQISFQVPVTSNVTVTIYNTLGQRIRTLVQAEYQPGYHQVRWDGLSETGIPVAGGIYIYRFNTGDYRETRKMIFLK